VAQYARAEHLKRTRCGYKQAGDHGNGRRFAGTIATQKTHYFSLAGVEAQVLDGDDIAKTLGEIFYADRDIGHSGNMGRGGATRQFLCPFLEKCAE